MTRTWKRRDPICTVEGCGRKHDSRGFCSTHRVRWAKYGDPLYVAPNARWTGENASYAAMHHRLTRTRGKPNQSPCVDCGNTADEWSYTGNAPDERIDESRALPYSLDMSRYVPRCMSCHRKLDLNRNTICC